MKTIIGFIIFVCYIISIYHCVLFSIEVDEPKAKAIFITLAVIFGIAAADIYFKAFGR